MQLTDDDIQEFTALWKKEFGEEISEEEARHQASQLIQLYSLLVRPLTGVEENLESSEGHSHELFSLLPKID